MKRFQALLTGLERDGVDSSFCRAEFGCQNGH